MSNASGSLNDMRQRIEADKRSIFEQTLNDNSTNTTNSSKEHKKISDAVYTLIFTDEDVDDSEELFNQILKKAEKAYKQDKEFKKKNPHLKNILDNFQIPSTKVRQRKSKEIEDSLKIINNFRRNLIETEVPKKTCSYTSIINAKNKKKKTSVKKSLAPEEKNPKYKTYPVWKTTETYTPIFPASTTPRWTENEFLPKANKMYTPHQIYNWVETTDCQINAPPSSEENVRTNAATCNSIIDNETFATPAKSAIDGITSIRSTLVQFKPSPPRRLSHSNSENSSISSNFPFIMENEENGYDQDIDNIHLSYEKYDHAEMDQDHLNENYTENFINNPKEQSDYKENFDKSYLLNNNNDTANETNGSCSKSFSKEPFFEDFIRNLNNSISNNYNMEVKCSMKFKLFQ
ncbi:PREDICTED: uncharacterized protein LOC105364875 [Ceratosolen solmsi marchali]|uniref:Uncharacterized protein LOC105364875 n=1 Tax=Ceratosolen solmsi marchali TaxID=326594 RepID=A0AAJ6YNC0_9HYME|nr:PREDICTED: uncharacterized protein LOC105364875 [Ceratosolen solmsi marchali]